MGHCMIVMAPESGGFVVTLAQFRAAAGRWRWPTSFHGEADPGDGVSDATLLVEPPGEPRFHVVHFRDEQVISAEGTPAQIAEVAVWAADSFPMTGRGELWLVDHAYSGHVVLRPRMAVQDVLDGWQSHDASGGT